ncbi:hypothetical protein [Persicobacter psychrovividus]|uniref:Uncharacterized protein n=1 Tax=Persicobacter psychrovividus TaxID=387638 RepID=A0ABM7VA52_9BACT|nr:hypothetical protein PEPS_00790 [Persicobacter psychrovividus]
MTTQPILKLLKETLTYGIGVIMGSFFGYWAMKKIFTLLTVNGLWREVF